MWIVVLAIHSSASNKNFNNYKNHRTFLFTYQEVWRRWFYASFSGSMISVSQFWLFVTTWTPAHQTSLSITNSWSLLKLMSIELVMPSNHLILCRLLLLLPSVFPSIRVFFFFFPVSQFFISGGQSIGASASASVLPMNIQDWFPLGWLVWSCSPRDSQGSSPTPQSESINSLALSVLYGPSLISVHDYWKNHSFDYKTFVGKMMSLLFNTLSRFVIALYKSLQSLVPEEIFQNIKCWAEKLTSLLC